MGLLIDTSALIQLERGLATKSELLKDRQAAISVVTVSELLHGVHRAGNEIRRSWRQGLVDDILASFILLPFDLRTARVHAEIWARLGSRGQIIGDRDLMIAATAISNDLELLTLNSRHFSRIDSLRLATF